MLPGTSVRVVMPGIFPIDEENIGELAKDIRANGQQLSIERLDGKILDGRRRFKACRIAGLEPKFKDVKVADPVAYVLSLNLHRRHLTPSQLSMIGARATALSAKLAAEAKERLARLAAKARAKGHFGFMVIDQTGKGGPFVGAFLSANGYPIGHTFATHETPEAALVALEGAVR